MQFQFSEQYSYKYIDIFRKYKAKFDKETKTWTMKDTDKNAFLKDKSRFDMEEEINMKMNWGKACEQLGHKYVKKGTPEYDDVKIVFKQLIKSH